VPAIENLGGGGGVHTADQCFKDQRTTHQPKTCKSVVDYQTRF
jgi:hypothetical protein